VSGPRAGTAPIALEVGHAQVDPEQLSDLVHAHADLFGVGIAVLSPTGNRLAAAGPGVDAPALGHHHIHPVYYNGTRIADLVVGPCLKRPERMPVGTVPVGPREALAAAIPELDHGELERVAGHLERVFLVMLRSRVAAPPPAAPSPAGPATDVASELARVKSNFLATVSHELRTPLTSVIGYSEMLLEGMAGPVTTEQREYLTTILGKSDHLLRLITSMLELARMDAAQPAMEQKPISILDVIERAATSLTSEADRRAIALSLPRGPVPRVIADQRKIRQVLVHLIANAIKFTPRGGDVVVAAEVGALTPAERGVASSGDLSKRMGVRVSVRDTGIGISPMAQAKIFEPFFQVDQSSTREYGGTGLGLSLAKSYVEAHGGAIWVHSQPGEGSTFTLSLPAVPEDLALHLKSSESASRAD
jgi:two-component system, NarL family, sensor histidine kinase BarA